MYSPADKTSYSRMAASALLAVSAGACLGVVLSFTPVATNLYAAPTMTRPATAVAVPVSRLAAAQAVPSQYTVEQVDVAQQAYSQAQSSSVSGMTILSGGLLAAAAAFFALAMKRSVPQSEQLAMLAASGKKGAAPAKAKGERPLWYPTAEAPEWLDGSMPGDRGFDPWGLSKPAEYLQFDLDALDQNAGKNPSGNVIGRLRGEVDKVSTDAFQPYSEVFGIQRFRECELQHGRWAMLAALGCIVGEYVTGVPWQSAGLVEVNEGLQYWGNPVPFTNSQVVWFEVLAMGAVEAFRNQELNPEKRCYPGGPFDPLGLTTKDAETTFRLKEAELKHGRLAMLAFLGFAAAALRTGLGASQSFGEWAVSTFS